MNYLYCLPFSYFFCTRLSKGSPAFHVIFEWGAAAFLVALLSFPIVPALVVAILTYMAFICLYEIGYIANDLFVAPGEDGGRRRGPQEVSSVWILFWIVLRLMVFLAVTVAMSNLGNPAWWAFFTALAVVFAFHNGLPSKELKAGTFLWLSWFRFMAPVTFAVPGEYVLGIGLACAMSYSAFRQLGYLDSKGWLQMPGRKRHGFRWMFFMWPLLGALGIGSFPGAKGFVFLAGYFAAIASAGALTLMLYRRFVQRTGN